MTRLEIALTVSALLLLCLVVYQAYLIHTLERELDDEDEREELARFVVESSRTKPGRN